jgi:thymidylate synthase (FAD)
MVEFKFHCSMPIFVARQWIRHRTASVNELSARYSLMPLLFYEPESSSFALQSTVNNQGRQKEPASAELYGAAVERWERLRASASDTYGWMIEEDVARELARIDLPLSTYTQWYWKIDLHNLLHFLRLRVDEHAQWEIREFGRVMAGMLQRVAPLSYEAWLDYEVMGGRLTAADRVALDRLLETAGDGVVARQGASLDAEDLQQCGMSAREVREFVEKLRAPERPDFSLDLSRMRSAEQMADESSAAVPVSSP